MAEKNKSYRIRTTVGREADSFLEVHLDQDYDSLEILSLKISDKDTYKLHNSDYGVVVGRVLANGNFGVPNAKISVFIPADEQNSNMEMWNLYPYSSTSVKNVKDIRYNLLPDESVKDCHKAVGTFPHKTYLLENDALLEVFDKYYLYTTRTNAAGDYLICGVPTGMQTLHMDLDLSDCGILSQRPRDFAYKGYTIEQFDNPNQFKKDENIDSLAQIFSQDQPVYVQPFWGNEENGEEIGITRADIQISFKFEPTCVFMGSAISDNASNGVGKKCVPTNQMGAMDELTAGEGTIEMIRKTPGGHVEEFAIKGNQLINGNGVWCYQIPMNLDYMMTDEYGHMVPTDDPEKGIPTRARVRFRASLTDMEGSSQSYYRAKYLIPNNPSPTDQKVDYNFGTYTEEDSYRDLFWNGVYTVKSYIPRFQKSKRWKSERFSGIKNCNYYGNNNPMPYNNMRIRLPFMFTVLCIFVKLFIKIVTLVNRIIAGVIRIVLGVVNLFLTPVRWIANAPIIRKTVVGKKLRKWCDSLIAKIINKFIKGYGIHCTYIGDGLCPDMEGWYFAPGCGAGIKINDITVALLNNTLAAAVGGGENLEDLEDDPKEVMNSTEYIDETSTDTQNTAQSEEDTACVTRDIDYLMNCFEMNLAQEYRVIKFDFYNDWVNGVLFFPRWMRKVKRKKKYKFSWKKGDGPKITTYYKDKVFGCMNAENSRVKKSRYYTQQCSLAYRQDGDKPWTGITTSKSCYDTPKLNTSIVPSKCHKKQGMDRSPIFGKKSGLVTEETTMLGQFVYYLKPCEWKDTTNGKVRTLLFATDIVLLGTLNDCDENGIPQAFKYLNNSSYIMPTNLALTTMDDDAYIYTSDKGTVCSSTNASSSSNKKGKTSPEQASVRRVTPDFESTNKAYAKTDGDQVVYEENDDPIPITESAGITWNYSGPGQDDVDPGKLETPRDFLRRLFNDTEHSRYHFLYYPGGHFLGLSCVNSDSNIKSCVNLKRICEVGATMSQRREDIRGYKSDGTPKYEYYVPTGLISNVDIEGAAFRSMFATLNHNKLVATEINETTGYKKYNFRYLRPDGFDGSLGDYVHMVDSPYNKKVNETFISDSKKSGYFTAAFGDLWQVPDDYDEVETKHTSRRTIEDSIDDYYMFRFGLDTFAAKEQKRHYLLNKGGKYSLPQYENSFYFYFGLKDGSTALDEFKKQFFSECESNNIAKTPSISVVEKIDSETFRGDARVIIDNMLPTYTITIKDNTGDFETIPPVTSKDDVFWMATEKYVSTAVTCGLTIGHEYTITVTDSLGQTVTKTFVFGASAVKVDAETIHFRSAALNVLSRPVPTEAKYGGYIKINDLVKILRNLFTISGTDPATGEPNPEKKVTFKFKKQGSTSWNDLPNTSYVDASNEKWYLFYVDSVGVYEVAILYKGKIVSIFTTTVDDNTKINLFISCDYLAYKPEYNTATTGYFNCYSPSGPAIGSVAGLRNMTLGDWLNGAPFISSGPKWQIWLMRHTFYRHTPNDRLAYDNYIYTKGNYEIAIFGAPETGNLLSAAGRMTESFYRGDYSQYQGYNLDDSYTFYPTLYWLNCENYQINNEDNGRHMFDAMAFSDDGRSAADATSDTVNGYSYSKTTGEVTLTGTFSSLTPKHGCIVAFENGAMLFGVFNGSSIKGYSSYPIYNDSVTGNTSLMQTLLSMATVYPTLQVPTMYKPFYAYVSAATWNVDSFILATNDEGKTIPEKHTLPLSYKVEGDVFNPLSYQDRFFSGKTAGDGEIQNYDTYLMFRNEDYFWTGLTNTGKGGLVPEIQTDLEYKPHHERDAMFEFGNKHNYYEKNDGYGQRWPITYDRNDDWATGNIEFAFGRELVHDVFDEKGNSKYKDVEEIAYAIKEGLADDIPNGENTKVFTERYSEGDFDLITLKERHSIANVFIEELKLKVYDATTGINGDCAIYTEDAVPENTEFYAVADELFDIGPKPLEITENGSTFCLGVYNHKSKHDIKGSTTPIEKTLTHYYYSETQDNGAKLQKSVRIGDLDKWTGDPEKRNKKSQGELDLDYSGITLVRQYQLKKDYRRDLTLIGPLTSPGNKISIVTPGNTSPAADAIFNGRSKKTLICKYEKPDDGTKNKLVVYKLYPIEALDRIYPASPGGIEPYLYANTGGTYTKEAQDATITISTNVKFRSQVTGGTDWLEIISGDIKPGYPDRVHEATVTNISIRIKANTGSNTSERTGYIYLECIEEGVEITDENRDKLTTTITIVQSPDEIAPMQKEIENFESGVTQALENM